MLGRIIKIKLKTLAVGIVVIVLSACANNVTVLDKRAQLKPSAQAGSAQAQYQLGQTYCCGWGAGYDRVIARDWFCKSAMQGYGPAQFQLGRMLAERMDSHSTPSKRENLIEAYMWYSLAALQHVPLAAVERDALGLDMRSQELNESGTRMRKWQTLKCN